MKLNDDRSESIFRTEIIIIVSPSPASPEEGEAKASRKFV